MRYDKRIAGRVHLATLCICFNWPFGLVVANLAALSTGPGSIPASSSAFGFFHNDFFSSSPEFDKLAV